MGVVAEGQQQYYSAKEFAHAEECLREVTIQMERVSGCAYFFENRSAAEEHVAGAWGILAAPPSTPTMRIATWAGPVGRWTSSQRRAALVVRGQLLQSTAFCPFTNTWQSLGVGIYEQSRIGKRFVRRHGGSEPDDVRTLGRNGSGAEPVSSARARIGRGEFAARRIAFVEEPGTIETRRSAGAVRDNHLGTHQTRRSKKKERHREELTGTAQWTMASRGQASLSHGPDSGKRSVAGLY